MAHYSQTFYNTENQLCEKASFLHFQTITLMKKLFLLAAGVASFAALTAAPVRYGQTLDVVAGGATVKLTVHGDEYHHYYSTPDGCPVVLEADGWRLASVGADGLLTPSAYKLRADDDRTPEERAFVARNSSAESLQALSKAALANRALQTPKPSANRALGLFPNSTYPTTGSPKALVLVVEFADKAMNLTDAHAYFNGLLNTNDFNEWGATGSASDFYNFSSAGQFTPQFDLYGPVTLPENCVYYGGNNAWGNDMQAWKMVVDACQLLDDQVDFSQYDTDGDGEIDNVFIFYAGQGEASGGGPECIWPHAGYVGSNAGQDYYFDGVRLYRYACTNEWGTSTIDGSQRPDGIGTFVHEFSHVMGLPDLYTTQYTGAFTPGAWTTMDQGPYSNDGRTPPMLTAFERHALGWIQPVDISGGMQVLLPNLAENTAAIIPTYKDTEYFLLENRQKEGWDSYIPGHGMLVWHIDYVSNIWMQNLVNNDNTHQYVDIEEADNYLSEANRAGDSFPGAMGITSFTDDTAPSMRAWSGRATECPITGIVEENGLISFSAGSGTAEPAVSQTLAPGNENANGFTARWTVAEGKGHVLSVYTRSRGGQIEYLPGYEMYLAGNDGECEITGTRPGTIYYYTVRNLDGISLSLPSEEAMAYTGDNAMEHFQAEALEATEVTYDAFRANWQPLFGAVDYRLNVARVNSGGEISSEDVDFFFSIDCIPENWSFYKGTECTLTAYCGASAPSIKFSDGGWITSPQYNGSLTSVSFWQRGNGAPEGSVVKVEEYLDGGWSEVALVNVESQKGGTTSTVESFAGGNAVRLTFDSPTGKGSVCIDDIHVEYSSQLNLQPLEDYTDLVVEGTSALVSGLDENTSYVYTVRASNGTLFSRPSAAVRVQTPQSTAVRSAAAEGMRVRTEGMRLEISGCKDTVTVTDPSGRIVARGAAGTYTMPAHGLYIITAAEGSFKAVL